MKRTIFKITKMDCPSEEQLIRMKLANLSDIKSLDFNIPDRILTVSHEGDYAPIYQKLDALNFNTSFVSCVESNEVITSDHSTERKLLWQVLVINFFFFVLEIITGFIYNSMGLVADSLDMLADSLVYFMALLVVGGTLSRKRNVAAASGYFQILLAILGLGEVVRRFLGFRETPTFQVMIVVSVLALIGNALCLYLLQKSKSEEAHMKASQIFTSNDIIVNLGVILAAVLVYATNSRLPDLIIGIVVFFIVGRGAIKILKL